MTSTGTNFEPTYFARQATKSDAKLRWQYDRMIGFAGVRLYSSSRVLDIGCGAAPGLRYLQSRGIFAVGCDVSTAALAAARAALATAELVCCDLEKVLPLRRCPVRSVDPQRGRRAHRRAADLAGRDAARAAPGRIVRADHPEPLGCSPPRRRARRPDLDRRLRPDPHQLADAAHPAPAPRKRGLRPGWLRTGWKPIARISGRRLPVRLEVPYPPLVGNGIMACGRA